jgi:hypothetical protein
MEDKKPMNERDPKKPTRARRKKLDLDSLHQPTLLEDGTMFSNKERVSEQTFTFLPFRVGPENWWRIFAEKMRRWSSA